MIYQLEHISKSFKEHVAVSDVNSWTNTRSKKYCDFGFEFRGLFSDWWDFV